MTLALAAGVVVGTDFLGAGLGEHPRAEAIRHDRADDRAMSQPGWLVRRRGDL
ncbi:hypothetical protein [Kitasatospora sp. NPDC088783]|uniref:hypothetical protein n=1 Tax=Kitasatospora sp. NPDC088783 TaxID=3364077 RepID=UPI00383056BE